MEMSEAVELMRTVQAVEGEADLYTKSELSELLASQVRSFIEAEFIATGDYGELMNAIGEYEAEFGEPYAVEDEPPASPGRNVVEQMGADLHDIGTVPGNVGLTAEEWHARDEQALSDAARECRESSSALSVDEQGASVARDPLGTRTDRNV